MEKLEEKLRKAERKSTPMRVSWSEDVMQHFSQRKEEAVKQLSQKSEEVVKKVSRTFSGLSDKQVVKKVSKTLSGLSDTQSLKQASRTLSGNLRGVLIGLDKTESDNCGLFGLKRKEDLRRSQVANWIDICENWGVRDQDVNYSALDVFESVGSDNLIRALSRLCLAVGCLNVVLAAWSVTLVFCAVSFGMNSSISWSDDLETILWLDFVLDFVYFIGGPMMQLRTTTLDFTTCIESFNAVEVRMAAFRSPTFWLDIVSCMPLILLRTVDMSSNFALVKLTRAWRLVINPKHVRLPLRSWGAIRLARLLLLVLALGHLAGGLWIYLAYDSHTIDLHLEGQHHEASGGSGHNAFALYAIGLQRGIIVILGRMNDAGLEGKENLFFALLAPVGMFVQGTICGQVSIIMHQRESLEAKEQKRLVHVRQAVARLRPPTSLQCRILSYYTYQRLRGEGMLGDLLEKSSDQLKWEVLLYVHQDIVLPAKFLKMAPPTVLRNVILALEAQVCLPGDYVCRSGDASDGMYFLTRGVLAVLSASNIMLKELLRGSYFGEVALLTGSRRSAFVRADTFCWLEFLAKESFDPILSEFPETIDLIIKESWEDMRYWYLGHMTRSNEPSRASEEKKQLMGEIGSWVQLELNRRLRNEVAAEVAAAADTFEPNFEAVEEANEEDEDSDGFGNVDEDEEEEKKEEQEEEDPEVDTIRGPNSEPASPEKPQASGTTEECSFSRRPSSNVFGHRPSLKITDSEEPGFSRRPSLKTTGEQGERKGSFSGPRSRRGSNASTKNVRRASDPKKEKGNLPPEVEFITKKLEAAISNFGQRLERCAVNCAQSIEVSLDNAEDGIKEDLFDAHDAFQEFTKEKIEDLTMPGAIPMKLLQHLKQQQEEPKKELDEPPSPMTPLSAKKNSKKAYWRRTSASSESSFGSSSYEGKSRRESYAAAGSSATAPLVSEDDGQNLQVRQCKSDLTNAFTL